MGPAYAKKAGMERKKRAKLVPGGVDQVQRRTGMGFVSRIADREAHAALHRE
jgi:hypothetical protein